MAHTLPKNKLKVLLLEGIHPGAKDLFEKETFQVELLKQALKPEELAAKLDGVHVLGIRSKTHVTKEVLAHEHAKRLLTVGCFCIGTNQVDLDAAMMRGIPVFNAPFSNTRSVAELVIAETILLLRGVPRRNAELHRGLWNKSAAGAHETRSKVLGIVGYGHIGTQVGVLAESLGMQVLYYDIETKLALGNARPAASLRDLLAHSDIVSLHVPETPQTKWMIGAKELATMRTGSTFSSGFIPNVLNSSSMTARTSSPSSGRHRIESWIVPTNQSECVSMRR